MTTSLVHQLRNRSLASRSSIVHIPQFLSPTERSLIQSLKDEHHATLGIPPPARRNWRTTYLNAGNLFGVRAPALHEKLRDLRFRVDLTPFNGDTKGENESDSLLEGLGVRCIEVHESGAGGSLNDPKHYDVGSVVTADVLLQDDFEGGVFSTLDYRSDGDQSTSIPHNDFAAGDAIIFPSYKYHSVSPVTSGRRATLVLEFWEGEENYNNDREASVPLVVGFTENGGLGIEFAFEDAMERGNVNAEEIRDGRPVVARVVGVRPHTQAASQPDLVAAVADESGSGWLLTHVDGIEVFGLGYPELDDMIAGVAMSEVRPVELRFDRHAVPTFTP